MMSSEEESEGVESDIWTEYGGEVTEDKTGKDRVYIKWKPPKNKLTQEITRKKSGKRKSLVPELAEERRQSRVDSAMTAVSAGAGKSASQIFFYDWSDNYRRVIKEMKAQKELVEVERKRGSVSGESNLSSVASKGDGKHNKIIQCGSE